MRETHHISKPLCSIQVLCLTFTWFDWYRNILVELWSHYFFSVSTCMNVPVKFLCICSKWLILEMFLWIWISMYFLKGLVHPIFLIVINYLTLMFFQTCKTIFKEFLSFRRWRKVIQVRNDTRVSKWLNYPLTLAHRYSTYKLIPPSAGEDYKCSRPRLIAVLMCLTVMINICLFLIVYLSCLLPLVN